MLLLMMNRPESFLDHSYTISRRDVFADGGLGSGLCTALFILATIRTRPLPRCLVDRVIVPRAQVSERPKI